MLTPRDEANQPSLALEMESIGMKARAIVFLWVFASSLAQASDRAVEALHYEVNAGLAYSRFEFDSLDGDEDGIAISGALQGAMTWPMGPYLGGFANVGFLKGASEQYDGDLEMETENLSGAAGIFLRSAALGRLELGYERERDKLEITWYGGSSYDYADTESFYSYLARIEGYLGPVTVGVRDQRTFYPDAYSDDYEDYVVASLNWYVARNVRIGVWSGFDNAKDTYAAEIEFQPRFFGNVCGINVKYLRSDEDDHRDNGIAIAFNVYFDNRFDLLTRDRHYR